MPTAHRSVVFLLILQALFTTGGLARATDLENQTIEALGYIRTLPMDNILHYIPKATEDAQIVARRRLTDLARPALESILRRLEADPAYARLVDATRREIVHAKVHGPNHDPRPEVIALDLDKVLKPVQKTYLRELQSLRFAFALRYPESLRTIEIKDGQHLMPVVEFKADHPVSRAFDHDTWTRFPQLVEVNHQTKYVPYVLQARVAAAELELIDQVNACRAALTLGQPVTTLD